MAGTRERDGRLGGASLRGFVSLGSTAKRTKAGAKLAVPRPVNLPSLKKENAAHEPLPSATGGSGWNSGGPVGEAAPADAHRAVDAPAAGLSSSLVEKASWAGQGRPAGPSGPAPWEQPRALSLREFPSLAAAAAAGQQPSHRSSSGPHPTAESGAWDEDERGRGLPSGGSDRARGPRRDGPYSREDGHGYDWPPPYYGRRGEFSPPPWEREHSHDRRRFEGEEPGYGRYSRDREPQHHERGGYGGWHDGRPPRDWRHDRFDGPQPRYGRGPPPRDYGRRYGRPPHEEEPDYPVDQPPRDRHYEAGRFERGGQDPALFPPLPPHRSGHGSGAEPEHGLDRWSGSREPHMRRSPSPQRRSPTPPQRRSAAQMRVEQHAAEEQAPVPPPPPPKLQQVSLAEEAEVQRPAGAASRLTEQPGRPSSGDRPEPTSSAHRPDPQAAAAAATARPPSSQQAELRADGAGEQVAPARAERTAASAAAAAAGQQVSSKGGARRNSQPAALPPPPPAVPKPPPPPPQPVKTSVVKPGVSWKAMLAGVPDEAPPAAAAAVQPAGSDDVDKSDKGSSRDSRRSRGKKDGKKETAAAPAAPAAVAAAPAAAQQAAGAGKRGKQRTRGKKGSDEGALQDAAGQCEQMQAQAGTAALAAAGKAPAGRSKGRGRSKEAELAAEEQAGSEASQGPADEVQPEVELAAAAATAPEAAETLPAAAQHEPQAVAAADVLEPVTAPLPAAQHSALIQPAALVEPLQPAPAAAAVAIGPAVLASEEAVPAAGGPLMGAAFGWSAPLADELSKLQLSSAAGAPASGVVAPLAGAAVDRLGGDMALLPTLGRDLREPSPPLVPQPMQSEAPAAAAADSMVDVITSLPADLTLELAPPQPGHAAPGLVGTASSGGSPGLGRPPPFGAPSPPPPSASPPPFPGGLFPSASASWQAQPPSKEAVQLFEAAGPAPTFNFGSINSHMQFGPVAAAFGQHPQQQQFGPGGVVDWSSPAPSPPPPMVGVTGGLMPTAVFGPGVGVPVGHSMRPPPGLPPSHLQHGSYGAPPSPPPARPPSAAALEDPAAALPDDVFDLPVSQQQQHYPQHGGQQANGHPRGRGFAGRSRGRGPRYPPHHQHQHQQHGGYGQQGYAAAGAGFPPQMPGWPNQAPHFLPPQLVGSRQQGNSGRGRGRGRNTSGQRNNAGGRQHKQQPRAE